jgi:hypothetical protein
MARSLASRFCSLLCILCFPVAASAVITNPLPGVFGPDDGSTTFTPTGDAFFLEFLDIIPGFGVGDSFGFYRTADPGTPVTVFDAADQAPPDQTAFASFSFGGVFDIDAGVGQSLFTPGFGPLGFFLTIDIPGSPITVYSEPSRNAGFDLVATFPSLVTPGNYLIGFELPDPTNGGVLTTAYFASVTSRVPAPAPEPSTLILAALGLAVCAGRALGRVRQVRDAGCRA